MKLLCKGLLLHQHVLVEVEVLRLQLFNVDRGNGKVHFEAVIKRLYAHGKRNVN